MRSEIQEPTQSLARVRDRFGVVLTASASMLSVEAVIAMIVLVVWGQTQENPGLPYNATGGFILIMVAPFVAALGVLPSLGVVMPLLVVAGWLGRRLSGREAWWWVPAVATAATALPILAATVLVEVGLVAGLGAWIAVTAALTATALVARRPLLPDRPRLSGRAMFGRVALYGTLAVVTAGTLAAISLSAGIGYVPPHLSTDQVTGSWSDRTSGTLILTHDGKATANRVKTFDIDDSFEPVVHKCTGIGTWKYDSGAGPWSQEVDVSVDGCAMDAWEVLGNPEHPKLYVHIGDSGCR